MTSSKLVGSKECRGHCVTTTSPHTWCGQTGGTKNRTKQVEWVIIYFWLQINEYMGNTDLYESVWSQPSQNTGS